ncbi:hypothetical protein OH76DRAFT_455853 [Lentinus brumalis]|uniref:Uncharacterized protein n=1 Tax=Lentinus brumalis TaxID=2498619 RepID=A0A371DDE6_9APHY|nr:hypothetical protein OH76DRAFT_455853 [Polyporus brumalis]
MSPQPGVYYGPDEDENTKDLERYFIAGDFVCGVGYGIMLVLWTSCVRYLWSQRRRSPKTTLLLVYLCLIFVVETIFCIVQARTVQVIYIENRNYPGGPWQYFLDTQYLAINVMFYATLFILTFLCDLLVLWRCWVVWIAAGPAIAYGVITLPSVMLLASFVMGTLWTLQSSQPNLSMYSAQPLAFGIAYYTLSLGVNIILTSFIILRLMFYRRTHLAHLPPQHAKQYLSLATVIIESAALYSVFSVAFLVSYAMQQPINQIWLGFAQAAQQISTYLIVHRVAIGTAWTSNAMESHTVTDYHTATRPGDMGHDQKRTGPSNVQFTSQFSVSGTVSETKADVEEVTASAV